MKMLPYLLKFKVRKSGHAFSLWLPLFIIGPLLMIFVLAVLLIALPSAFLSFLFTWRTDWLRWYSKTPAILEVMTYLSGLKIDFEDGEQQVSIMFK